MKNITLKDFSEFENIDYNGQDIVIMSDISSLPRQYKSLIMDIVSVIICNKGEISMNINGKSYNVFPNDVVILAPNTYIDSYSSSEDIDCTVCCFSLRPLDNNFIFSKNMFRIHIFLQQHPVMQIGTTHLQQMKILRGIIPFMRGREKKKYQNEIMELHLRSLVYLYLQIIEEEIEKQGGNDGFVSQADLIFSRFIDLLQKNNGKKTSLAFLSKEMGLSTRYLSNAVKQASGYPASYWIHFVTIQMTIKLLKYSSKSIKEIAYEMDFSDTSSFKHFFKSQTGVSPSEFREQLLKNKEK